MVIVEFQVEGFGKDEYETQAALRDGVTPVEADRLWGSVQFYNDGVLEVAIKYDLLGFADCLFNEISVRLDESGHATLLFKDWAGEFSFQPDATGMNIRITGPVKGSAKICGSFPKDELIYQLQECGKRFAKFSRQVAELQAQLNCSDLIS